MSLFLRAIEEPLVEVAALLALVVVPEPAVPNADVYAVPFCPSVGSGTLPLTSHIPLVYAGHAGGFAVGE